MVEGFFAGQHQSPHKGFSIEFAEHREYTPGVDPRHLDWRVLGRRDKLYVKQYEEETSLRCYLLLDKSASMGYKSDGARLTKLEYASYLAASLAYLMAFQHDAVGPDDLRHARSATASRPAGDRATCRSSSRHLEKTDPGGETSLAATMHRLAESLKRRALIVVLSDLFDDPEPLVAALNTSGTTGAR